MLESINATSHWSTARPLDWSGPYGHWRLTGIPAACEYRTPTGVRYLTMPDKDILALSHALDLLSCQLAASPSTGAVDYAFALPTAIAAQPQLASPTNQGSRIGNFVLAPAEAETGYRKFCGPSVVPRSSLALNSRSDIAGMKLTGNNPYRTRV